MSQQQGISRSVNIHDLWGRVTYCLLFQQPEVIARPEINFEWPTLLSQLLDPACN